MVDEIRQITNSSLALSTSHFQPRVAGLLGRRTVRGSPGRKPKPPVEDSE